MRPAVVLPSPEPTRPITFPAKVVRVDQEGRADSACLVGANRTKMFATPPNGVLGATIHSEEGAKKCFSIFGCIAIQRTRKETTLCASEYPPTWVFGNIIPTSDITRCE